MKAIIAFVSAILFVGSIVPAVADDWTGQKPPPLLSGTLGPFAAGNNQMTQYTLDALCQPANTPPPCTGGSVLGYVPVNPVQVDGLPANSGPGSNLGVLFEGAYNDTSSPTGLSYLSGSLSLDQFARSSTVDGLTTEVGGLSSSLGMLTNSFNALSATVGDLSTQMQTFSSELGRLQQQLQMQDRTLRAGVAMALAMGGVGDLAPDEKVAVTMNFGTYGGDNGIAAGVTFRVADHVAFNGGFGTGLGRGLSGGRVGVRFAW
jgi:hypothetical protein